MSSVTSSVMSSVIARIAAEADREPPEDGDSPFPERSEEETENKILAEFPIERPIELPNRLPNRFFNQGLVAHQFPARVVEKPGVEPQTFADLVGEEWVREEERRERRIYRNRTVAMLRRYMKYSMETGRLPSLLGKEFFRTKVTSYTVVTFEDRVIFVHDMETCLGRLDEFSRQLIARRILQEHDCWATAKLLHCNEKTVRRMTPLVLDQLSEILLNAGLLEEVSSNTKNSCQGDLEDENSVSDCEDGENNF
jgi:hypothetical protein